MENISTRHWGIIGCSARTGEGLLEGIDWIVRDIAGRLFTYLWLWITYQYLNKLKLYYYYYNKNIIHLYLNKGMNT